MAALPFEHPKLAMTAITTPEDFAARLDAAIRRSEKARVIEHEPPVHRPLPPTGPTPRPMNAPGEGAMTELEILRTIQADLASVKTDVASMRHDVSALNKQVSSHTRLLNVLQQDVQMIRAAVNDIAN